MSDLLSAVLRLIDARAGLSGQLRAGGRWALDFPAPATIKFNAVVEGGCWLRVETRSDPIWLDAGDAFLLVAAQPYVLASDPALEPEPAGPAFRQATDGVAVAGDGIGTMVIGGQVVLDPHSAELLIGQLPDLLVVRGDAAGSEQLRWALQTLVVEARDGLPGGTLLADQLAQMIVILLLRAFQASGGAPVAGWLRGLGDARVAAALQAIQADPARGWTVRDLASEAGMSRSSFAERFAALIGTGPMGYLSEWRLQLAADLLRREALPLGIVAERSGYGSESALVAAFRRRFGVTPARYRRSAAGMAGMPGAANDAMHGPMSLTTARRAP